MENALFVNYNPSNNPSLTEIKKKDSEGWVKERLKELISLNSIHVCGNDKNNPNENVKRTLSKEGINEDENKLEPYYNVNQVIVIYYSLFISSFLTLITL